MQAFAARLDSHSEAGEAGFEAHLVGDDAFQGGDVGAAIAVHIEADGEVEAGLGTEKAIKQKALGSVNGEVNTRGAELDVVTESLEGTGQRADSDVGAAAAGDIERS